MEFNVTQTMKQLKILVVIVVCLSASSPVYADSQVGKLMTQKHKFIQFILPKIKEANHEVLALRKQLIYLHYIWRYEHTLTKQQSEWLYKLARDYRVNELDFTHTKTWNILMRRVDGLPNSLVLAQAINESAWGTSYFAQHGKNYFGQWCAAPGCGIVPRRRPSGSKYEVKRFDSTLDSVKSYLLNIDTHKQYIDLRTLRQQMRVYQEILNSLVLAEGLHHYSQKGVGYVKILQSIINSYDLQKFDDSDDNANQITFLFDGVLFNQES